MGFSNPVKNTVLESCSNIFVTIKVNTKLSQEILTLHSRLNLGPKSWVPARISEVFHISPVMANTFGKIVRKTSCKNHKSCEKSYSLEHFRLSMKEIRLILKRGLFESLLFEKIFIDDKRI